MPSRALKDTEVSLLKAQARNPLEECLIALGLKTGFRISELLSLTWEQVLNGDMVRNTISVNRRNMKGKVKSRSVVLHAEAKEAIEKLMHSLGYKPEGKLLRLNRHQALRIIKRLAQQAQIEGSVCLHSMRKTFGTRIYKASNNNLIIAQKALGHVSVSSTQAYLCVEQETVDALILSV